MNKKSKTKKTDIIGVDNLKPQKHPEISGVSVFEERNTFPVSWLQKLEYCEYQLYLENFQKIKAAPTVEMIVGSQEHHRLEAEFKKDAEEATFEEMLDLSETREVFSRELPVMSVEYGIHGLIDEIQMTPNEFIIIDDKPGRKFYSSNANQVFGYCLAFKDMIGNELGGRNIYAALRERGTDNIYWQVLFDENCEAEIIRIIKRVHDLILGAAVFKSTNNPNKCNKCRFLKFCDKRLQF